MNEHEDEDFSELDAMGGQVDPNAGRRALRFNDIPEGTYQGVISTCEMVRLKGKPAVKMAVQVAAGEMKGAAVELTWWIEDVNGMNRFAADFGQLGVNTKVWGKNPKVPLSQQIQQACAGLASAMRGIRFGKTIRSDDVTGKVYHNLLIYGLADATPEKMPASPPAPATGKAPAGKPPTKAPDTPF